MNCRLAALAAFAFCLSSTAQTRHHTSTQTAAKPADDTQLYRNSTFDFRYRIPYGWVERTKEMQEGNDAAKGEVLLAMFERPPQVTGDTINSAVVIASVSASAYPGLKRAEDFLGTLTELTAAQGFKTDGDPSEVLIESQRLVRVDFSKPRSEKLTMHQSTLVLLAKGQIVSFTFIADSADGVNDLIDGLGFSSWKSKGK